MMIDINEMTEDKFLEIWDRNKDEIREWDDLREYLEEVIGAYKREEEVDSYKLRVYGTSIYKIKDRYFRVPWISYSCDFEWSGYEIKEVQRKVYTKRVEVEEWVSMPD